MFVVKFYPIRCCNVVFPQNCSVPKKINRGLVILCYILANNKTTFNLPRHFEQNLASQNLLVHSSYL